MAQSHHFKTAINDCGQYKLPPSLTAKFGLSYGWVSYEVIAAAGIPAIITTIQATLGPNRPSSGPIMSDTIPGA